MLSMVRVRRVGMAAFDWNDVRFVLAAVRAGSALAAAKSLKVSQPTVGRRIAALEESLGACLFDRSVAGLQLSDRGQALMPRFEALEAAARDLETAARAEERRVSGLLRVTTNEIIASYGLAPALREFRAQYPDVRVEVIVTDGFLDLSRGEADVAIRGGARPAEAGVVARRLGVGGVGVFGSEDYFAAYGRPGRVEDLNDHVFVCGEGPYALVEPIIRRFAPDARFEYRSSSALNIVANARHGLGLALLPTEFFTPDREPDLALCFELPDMQLETWLATHERLRLEPRVRAFLDFVAAFEGARRRIAAASETPG